MPAYNYERFIARAIESALAQDYPAEALEILVIDDGSTDGTPAAVAPYRDRVRYLRKENGGINSAVNLALSEATGTYIAFLDADDEWPPDKTARQVEFLERHPAVGLLHGDMEVIDEAGHTVEGSFFASMSLDPRRGHIFGELLRRNFVSGGATMMRASLRHRYHPLPPEAAWTDHWFAARIAPVAEIDFLPETLYRYRLHGNNTLFGASGEQLTRIYVERELPWRRWLLSHVEPGEAGAQDLLLGWAELENIARLAAHQSGLALAELLPVDDERRAAAAAELARARAAAGRGEGDAVACHVVGALARDPFSADARRRLRALAGAVAEATADADGAPKAGAPDAPVLHAARRFKTLAFAEELVDDPALLAAYAGRFSGRDDATLVIYARRWGPEETLAQLGPVVAAAGLDDDTAADLLAHPAVASSVVERSMARSIHAVLTHRPPADSFADADHFDAGGLDELRELAELRWSVAPAGATG